MNAATLSDVQTEIPKNSARAQEHLLSMPEAGSSSSVLSPVEHSNPLSAVLWPFAAGKSNSDEAVDWNPGWEVHIKNLVEKLIW